MKFAKKKNKKWLKDMNKNFKNLLLIYKQQQVLLIKEN